MEEFRSERDRPWGREKKHISYIQVSRNHMKSQSLWVSDFEEKWFESRSHGFFGSFLVGHPNKSGGLMILRQNFKMVVN